MKVSVIGGGAWGTTLAQALSDNEHEVLIRDVNSLFVEKINKTHTHPFFHLLYHFQLKLLWIWKKL